MVRISPSIPYDPMRLPLVVRWLGKINKDGKQGLVNHSVVSGLDLLPTILSIIGGKEPQNVLDGIDISRYLYNESVNLRPNSPLVLFSSGVAQCSLVSDFKACLSMEGTDGQYLYNLRKDRSESYNIDNDKPGVFTRMINEMWTVVQGLISKP